MTDSVPRHGSWWGTEDHRSYLLRDALRQFRFFARSLDVAGGFHAQDFDGAPIPGAPRELRQAPQREGGKQRRGPERDARGVR